MLIKEIIIIRERLLQPRYPLISGTLGLSLRTREIKLAKDRAIHDQDKAKIEAQAAANSEIQAKIAEDQTKVEADRKANEERTIALDERERALDEREKLLNERGEVV